MQRPWMNRDLAPDARADLIVAAMTEDEKFSWLSGPMAIPGADEQKPAGAIGSAGYFPAMPRLGVPAMQQTDASLGVGNLNDVRPGDNATALPSTLLVGATFDPAIARETGAVLGSEARAKGFNVVLAGGANLVRELRGGRSFEYISEDPLLTGVIMGNAVQGIQSQGVVSTTKHFALNAQETGRVMVSSDLAEPAMRESDLLAFQIGIEIGAPGAVMPGYNLVNGSYASENAFLLNKVLKGDWNYPGWVMSDWGATHSTVDAARAGLDVQSGANIDPAPYFGAPLRQAVGQGQGPQARIDDMVKRQLRSLIAVGAFDNPPQPGTPIDYTAHALVAQRAAESGIVLLRNEGGLLPFAQGAKRIAVIGGHADIGVLSGGGSTSVTPIGSVREEGIAMMGVKIPKVYQPSAPLQAIKAEAMAAEVSYLDGKDVAAARAAAAAADCVIVFAEEWRSESLDAQGMSLPDGQDALIAAVADANPRTAVVLETGGPVLMPWLERVPAVIQAFYPGTGGAAAIAGVLFGRVNPSGRLPYTFPAAEEHLPLVAQRDPKTTTSNPGEPRKGGIFHVSYDVEGSDVGYRWFKREGHAPVFSFGFGLSYTRFEHADLQVAANEGGVVVSFTVRNTGDRAGATVPQVYVGKPGEGGFVSRLGGFAKVQLAPGEVRTVTIDVEPRILARYSVEDRGFRIAGGRYDIRLADHAEDSHALMAVVELEEREIR
jgi:beta-glucosidase